ncbi:PAS domain-containing protein, partial [Amycolatopsis vancoresmycina]
MVSRPAPASTALPPMPGDGGPPGIDAFARAALEDVRDAVFLQDTAGVVRWANPAARALAGDAGPQLHSSTEMSGHVELAGHRRPARIRALPGGWHAWTVSAEDVPQRHVGEFLAEAGPRLAAARGRHGTA